MTRPAHRHPVNRAMHDNASRTQRAVDGFVAYFGSLRFIGWMTVVIIAWLAVNSLWLTKGIRWDPYPFILLNLAFSAQATYAAPLILLSQNRGAERDRLKAEHDYEVNTTALAEIRADHALTAEVHELTKAVHAAVVTGRLIEGNAKMTRNAFRAGGLVRGAPTLATATPVTYLADISEFQPDIADATYLAWSKAIAIRAMYGADHDDAAWYGGQRRADLHAGGAEFLAIYQYLVAGQSGAAQAQAFHKLVGPIRPGEVFVADYEEGAKGALSDWYNTMLGLYGAGIHPYLWTYTGEDFGVAEGALPVEWIAEYGAAEPATPHKLWQFTSSFHVPGVGTADCSVFHGTVSELAALAYAPPAPPKPADWVYGKPAGLRVTPGHTNFHATWTAPPQPTPDHYEVWVYEGTTCDRQTLVSSYPRDEPGPVTSPDPGGLKPRTLYTLHVSAFGVNGSHVKAGVFAEATFTTGG